MMDLLCLIGTAIGACAAFWPSYGNKIAFIVMWLMYQSLYQVGETFLWFQWDILLLEVSDYNKDGKFKKVFSLWFHPPNVPNN